MYIVVIAWLFVILMMAITEKNITAGVLTFFFYGFAPCALLLWLIGTPQRRRNKSKFLTRSVDHEKVNQPDRDHAESD